MKNEEILQKLFYVDLNFSKLLNRSSNSQEFKEVIQHLKRKSQNKPVENIRTEMNNDNIRWFDRLVNQNCKIIKLKLSDLCIDDYHDGINIGGLNVKRGDKIETISNWIKEDCRVKSLLSCIFFEELIYELPIIVRPYQKMYEIILGNHRAISALKKGIIEIKCLCFCEPSDPDLCNTLNFN